MPAARRFCSPGSPASEAVPLNQQSQMHDLFCKFHRVFVAEPVIKVGSLVSMAAAHDEIYIYKYMCNNCNVAQPKNQPNTQPGPIERHRRLGSRRTSESFRADDQVGICLFAWLRMFLAESQAPISCHQIND